MLLVWLVSKTAYSQVNRYMVFFTDKSDSEYSIDNPEEYLSERCLQRRENQEIGVTDQDLPVNQNYVEGIQASGCTTFFTSKWMNAVLVEAEESTLESLLDLEYVESYELAAPGSKLSVNPEDYELSYEEIAPSSTNSVYQTQLALIGVDAMHEDGFDGSGVSIALFDGGYEHANASSVFKSIFEDNRVLDTKDFVANQSDVFVYDTHGTSAFSCIGADLGVELVGTATGADFSLYITEDVTSEYRIEEYNWLFAAERADSAGVDIISSSVGYYTFDDPSMDYQYEDTDGLTAVVSKAAQWAADRGILVVNSVGNEGTNSEWPYLIFPSDADGVLAVAATNADGDRVGFSSIGPTTDGRVKPDVAALGTGVGVLTGSNRIRGLSGTSFSAPLVSGLAAGLWQKFPDLSNEDLKELIQSSGDRALIPDSLTGYGIPNYNFAGTDRVLSVTEVMNDDVSVFPNPFSSQHVSIRLGDKIREKVKLVLLSPTGQVISKKEVSRNKRNRLIKLNVSGSETGIYTLRVMSAGVTKNVKLLRY